MTTQPSFIDFNDTINDTMSSASSDLEDEVPPVNDAVGGDLSLVQHDTRLHGEDLADLPEPPVSESEQPVSQTLLSVLAKNRAGTWFSSQRARHAVWSFFCPSDPSLGWEERAKADQIDCLICHAQRYVTESMSSLCLQSRLLTTLLVYRTGELHPSFPKSGEHAPNKQEEDVHSYVDVVDEADSQLKKRPTSTFKYNAGKGNTSLKYHLERYHPSEYQAVMGTDKGALRKRETADDKPGEAAIGTYFRSVKKLKRESEKARTFFRLVTLLIVYARLPFSLVAHPVFKALVWFLDPTIPIPTRGELTNKLMPEMVKECKDSLCRSLDKVLGAAVTFDLWMSKKTDDILSVDLHFICSRWTWQHKHLGLVTMNGETRGIVVGRKLKEIFEEFNVMGKLFAMVFDGGANLSTAKTEIIRLHADQFCCTALGQHKVHTTSCLAHLINNSCNGAVLAAKAAKYKVRFSGCMLFMVLSVDDLVY